MSKYLKKRTRQIFSTLTVVLLSTALICTPVTSFAADTAVTSTGLINGDFENGTTGWKSSGTTATLESIDAQPNCLINGKGAKFTLKSATEWLYQDIKLQPGDYTWEFTVDVYSTNLLIGAYKSSIAAGNLITGDVLSSADKEFTAPITMSHRQANGDYQQGFTYAGVHRYIKYQFTLTEETTVCIAVRTGANGYLYADNMMLTKPADPLPSKLINGNFETGDLTGFGYNGTGEKIEIVSAPKSGDNVTINGYAAYIPSGGAKENYLIQALTLEAGKYTWLIDAWVITNGGWSMLFGVYTDLGTNGIGYGSNKSIGTGIGKNLDNNTGSNGSAFSPGSGTHEANVGVEFELEEKTTVYLSIRSSSDDHVYINNMSLGNFKITYNTNGGTEVKDSYGITGKEITLPKTEKDGFVFTGWYTDEACTELAGNVFAGDCTLYAGWATPDVVLLTKLKAAVDSNNAAVDVNGDGTVDINDVIELRNLILGK